jgi:hypothetical protein
MESYDRRRRTALLTCGIAVLGAICGTLSCQEKKPESSSKSRFDPQANLKLREISGQDPNFQIRINAGSPEEAATYAQEIKDNLGIELNANLDNVLKLCGYGALTGRDVEITPPDQLMAPFPGDVVASRFFAPKIIDVSDVGAPANTKQLGWRKVVRFRVKGPLATDKGITAMFLLFNVFQHRADVANDPFLPCIQDTTRCSQNNQVMLIVGNPRPGTDTAYWMVFKNAAVNGGQRTDNLPATFDGGDFPVDATNAVRPYYLPAACAECHGLNRIRAKLNYLDSDHWNDRIQDGDDFSLLRTQSKHGVLFDGGRDTASTTFKDAFSAVKTLNTEIRDQNRAAGGDDFQIRAVENWLRIHYNNTNFLPPIDRAIPAPPSNPNARVWSRQNQNDEALLKLLNQFCFRCHSSVKYNVFDKEAVFRKKRAINGYINLGLMPQDRKMDTEILRPKKDDLLRYVNALQ